MDNGYALEAATAICQYGGDSVEGYEAGADCAQGTVENGVPLSAEFAKVAWASGPGAEEIQDMYLREWVLLARTPCRSEK